MTKSGETGKSEKNFESKEALESKEELTKEGKKVLMLKGKTDVDERKLALKQLYGDGVEMLYINAVSSVEELKEIISKNSPGVVMIETDVMTDLVLAEVLLMTKIADEIQVRQSIVTTYLEEDKTSLGYEFRRYSSPIKKVRFV